MIDNDMLEAMRMMMREEMEPVKADIRTMKDDIQSLKIDNAKLITMEKKVDLLLEGQQGMNEKFQQLDRVVQDVEEIKIKISALESVTRDNVTQIKELRMAN